MTRAPRTSAADAVAERAVPAWRRLALVPLRERCFLLLALASAAMPATIALHGLLADGEPQPWAHQLLGAVAASLATLIGLLILEPPRSTSPGTYVAQLRARLERAQSEYRAALRRRMQEEAQHAPSRQDKP